MTRRPHSWGAHPSINCYKNHGCRCVECRALNAEYRRRERKPPRQYERKNAPRLSDEEVARLRRLVGLETK